MEETAIALFGIDVTQDDAMQYMASFGASTPCPVCRSNQWSVNFTPPGGFAEIVTLRTSDAAGQPGANSFPVYLAVCQTCGHVRTQAAYQLAMWVKSRKEAESNGGG